MEEKKIPYPYNTIRYSTLKYLQDKITRQCFKLPGKFDSLDQWQMYKSDLSKELLFEAVDVNFEYRHYIPVNVYRPM
jgi:hypothetical protein